MTADAADLITYSQLTVDCFFAEADRLGIANEALRDTATYNRVLESCITRLRAAVAQGVAERLSLVLTPAQAETIARHSLVPSVSAQPVRLTPEESRLAEALYFEAVKAVMAKQGEDLDDGKARQAARTLVRRRSTRQVLVAGALARRVRGRGGCGAAHQRRHRRAGPSRGPRCSRSPYAQVCADGLQLGMHEERLELFEGRRLEQMLVEAGLARTAAIVFLPVAR